MIQNIPNGLLSVLLLQQLRNCSQLDITRPFINRPNLAVPKHLLCDPLPHKSHTPHPLNRLAADLASNLRSVQLSHSGVLHKVESCFFFAGSVVNESTRGADFSVGLCELVLHALESADELVELFAVVPDVADARVSEQNLSSRPSRQACKGTRDDKRGRILGSILPRSERQTSHLSRNAYPAFVE